MAELSSRDLLQMHINPLKPLNLPSKRGLIPTNSEEEIQNTTEAIKLMKQFLHFTRVDRKQSRSEAIWIPEKSVAKVTRKVGKFSSNFGFIENGQTFLTPHDCLYLLETNYLDLLWNGVPFSIEQGYNVLINSKENLEKYRIFKDLSKNDYKIQTVDSIKSETNLSQKRVEENSTNDSKRIKTNDCKKVEANRSDLLDRLKDEGPKTAETTEKYSTLFNIYLPKKSAKNDEPDFEIIKKPVSNEFSLKWVSGKDSSTVTAFSENDSVSFYQFHQVDLENK